MIQNETWKITRVYSNSIDRDEVEQQFTIELWYAFENYDIATGNCISTYIFHRFKKQNVIYYILFFNLNAINGIILMYLH